MATTRPEAGRDDILDAIRGDGRGAERAASGSDASPETRGAVEIALAFMEEYAEVFEELAR